MALCRIIIKSLCNEKCGVYLQPQDPGLVVQLVRIHACHAWGRGFESRPDRKAYLLSKDFKMLCCL